MENVPRPARELTLIDQELGRLDGRRVQLLARRAHSGGCAPRRPRRR
ncbi:MULTISPECIES: hypothetical protein [unclassified Streptomyces]